MEWRAPSLEPLHCFIIVLLQHQDNGCREGFAYWQLPSLLLVRLRRFSDELSFLFMSLLPASAICCDLRNELLLQMSNLRSWLHSVSWSEHGYTIAFTTRCCGSALRSILGRFAWSGSTSAWISGFHIRDQHRDGVHIIRAEPFNQWVA